MTYTITDTTKEKSVVTITGEIEWKAVEAHRRTALKNLGETVSIDGFRKGHIPEKVLIEHIGENALLQEMAQRALAQAYPDILQEKQIDALGRPEVAITKLAIGNPLGFKIMTLVMPDVTVPEYKSIAKEEMEKPDEKIEIEDKEVDAVIDQIRQGHAKQSQTSNVQSQNEEDSANDNTKKKSVEPELPELTDDFVKTLGDFSTVDDFKTKIRESITTEKKLKVKEKKRLAILEALLKQTKLDMPDIFIEAELDKMMAQFKGDVERFGTTFAEYLKQIKKEENDLRKEWRGDAEKRAKTQLILNKIAEVESIKPDTKDVEKEVTHILSHHKDANKDAVRVYVETILTNEKVFQFLENI